MTAPVIRPLPPNKGVGFFSTQHIPEYDNGGYRVEQSGPYWNYYFTRENYHWPTDPVQEWFEKYDWTDKPDHEIVIDGFSPNLNKELHVGHLRNLALGNAIVRMTRGKAVALLGATLGVKSGAERYFDTLCGWIGYQPKKYYDVLMPTDVVEHVPDDEDPDPDATSVPEIWNGPEGKVIVISSDGRKLYPYYDLAFAQTVKPDYYVTGSEQAEHFKRLGLGAKHLPMGLIMGADGTKMKSRGGQPFMLEEAIQATMDALGKDTSGRKALPTRELAWNVLCWQMLSVSRSQNVKWNVDEWCRPESSGLYITYTNARVYSALLAASSHDDIMTMNALEQIASKHHTGLRKEMTDLDLTLAGWCEYARYHHAEALKKMDPCVIAHYVHDLARVLGKAYHAEKMDGGRLPFIVFMARGLMYLRAGMKGIGMFMPNEV